MLLPLSLSLRMLSLFARFSPVFYPTFCLGAPAAEPKGSVSLDSISLSRVGTLAPRLQQPRPCQRTYPQRIWRPFFARAPQDSLIGRTACSCGLNWPEISLMIGRADFVSRATARRVGLFAKGVAPARPRRANAIAKCARKGDKYIDTGDIATR